MPARSKILLCLFWPVALSAQEVFVSTLADQGTGGLDLRKEEIAALSLSGGLRTVLPNEMWNALLLDRDQDGVLDDLVPNVDALAIGSTDDFRTWQFSVATNFVLKDGRTIRDGDVFAFTTNGNLVVTISEDALAMATGTSTVDLDALAVGASGEIFFSFEDDEATTAAGLIAQNGGVGVLDEQVVFRLDPGQASAVIQLTQAQVAAAFNQALGTSVTTVVDVVGLEMDQDGGPQDLWVTSGSTSQSLRGRVVSTAQGGRLPTINGVSFDPLIAPWTAVPTLDALAVGATWSAPRLRITPATASSATGGVITVTVGDVLPGELVQFVASAPLDAMGAAFTVTNASGFAFVGLDANDPLFWITLQDPGLRRITDAGGSASYAFNVAGFPPAVSGVVQVITVSNLRLSAPGAWTILP